LDLSKIKSNFSVNMSHEIRSPINVILGMNEMILLSQPQRQPLGSRCKAKSRQGGGWNKAAEFLPCKNS
jgi:signal transduction histidine kinase